MIGIDTNVLIRYLVQDDEKQNSLATQSIDRYIGKSSSVFINNIIFCEIIWVLKRGYKYSKNQIVILLKEILTTLEFCFEDHKTLWLAMIEYEQSNLDFPDILIGKINALNACDTTFTFDSKAANINVFSILE
jgi:predicted nucleic-acid-binding protein